MQWNVTVPELLVTDYTQSLRFYTDLLGFQIMYERQNPPFAYLNQAGVQIMLEEYHHDAWLTGELTPPLGRGINLQMELSDIQPIYDRLLLHNYPLYRLMLENWYDIGETKSGQREFLVQDPDGYLLRFCQFLGEK